jgi:hypothetical protein
MTGADAIAELRALIARGEYLTAYDRAMLALETFPEDLEIHHLAVLALVRSGATATALAQIDARLDVRAADAVGVPAQLLEDIAALRARISKDHALATLTPERAATAAEAYEAVFERFHRSYSCINAATLWLLAGDAARSRLLAEQTLAITRAETPGATVDAYWRAVTEGEASLR